MPVSWGSGGLLVAGVAGERAFICFCTLWIINSLFVTTSPVPDSFVRSTCVESNVGTPVSENIMLALPMRLKCEPNFQSVHCIVLVYHTNLKW